MSVNWSRPIEAVHVDGRVMPVQRFIGLNGTNVMPTLDGGWFSFCEDGRHSFLECPWRIRNVAQPAPTPDDLTKRMEELVRKVSQYPRTTSNVDDWAEEARAIVALLPSPVDTDETEAQKLNNESPYDLTGLDRGQAVRNVKYIKATILAAIKRGRALERGEG